MTIEPQDSSLVTVKCKCALLPVSAVFSTRAQGSSQQVEPLQGADAIALTGRRGLQTLRGITASGTVLDGEDVENTSGDRTTRDVVDWLPNGNQATNVRVPIIHAQLTQDLNNGVGAKKVADAIIVRTNDPTFTLELEGQLIGASENQQCDPVALSGPLVRGSTSLSANMLEPRESGIGRHASFS